MNPRVLLLAFLGAPSVATAHDFWIEPATFRAHVSESVAIGLCEGDAFDGRPYPRDAGRVAQFVARGPAGEQPIAGRQGRELAGVARFASAGVYAIGYRSTPSVTEMQGWRFEQYLREEGLEHVMDLRSKRGSRHERVREAYSRYSKSLLRVGEVVDLVDAQPLGLRLELIPEFRLDEAVTRREHAFRLLFEGKPVKGVLMTATPRSEPDLAVHARTDADGRVRYHLGPGAWLITAVHMIEARPGTGADWESFWSSLTFELSANDTSLPAQRASRRLCASS